MQRFCDDTHLHGMRTDTFLFPEKALG